MANRGTQKEDLKYSRISSPEFEVSRISVFRTINVSLCIWIHMLLLYTVRTYLNIYTYIVQSTASIQRTVVVRVLNSSVCSNILSGSGKWRSHENNRRWARPPVPFWESTVNTGGKSSWVLASGLYPTPTHLCQEFANFKKILVDLWLDHT